MGFEELEQAIPMGEAQAPVLADEVEFVDPWDDATALGIVLADIDTAIAFEQSKNFLTQMEIADDLVRQYVRIRPWPNTDKPRSSLGMPVVLEAIEKLMPALHMAVWGSGKDPFLVKAIGRTKPEAAHARQHLLRWAIRQADFKEGSRLTLKNILTYGFGVGVYGWETKKITPRKYRMKPDGSGVERNPDTKPIEITFPTYEAANLRNIVIDPLCATQDARKGRFFAKRIPITAYDLDEMREDDTYKNIPTREELAVILSGKQERTDDSLQALKGNQTREYQAQKDTQASSKDPLAQPLELIEYTTPERIITVLQRSIVIRNEVNSDECLPIVSCAFIDVINSAFGFGVARLLSGEQRLQQGVVNTWIDSLALTLNPVFQALKSLGAGSQNVSIAPGRVITVEGELKPLVVPSVSTEAMNAIQNSEQRAYRRVGADGGTNMPTQAMRTGTGVQSFQGDIVQRLQYFIEIFLSLVFVPVLEAFLALCADKLTPEQIQNILGEEAGKKYEGDILDIYNAETKIEIISGVKLTARQAAAQVAPLLMQLLANSAVQDSLAVQGKKFDYAEFIEEYLELMGWDTEALIVAMTKEDLQRQQQQNAAFTKAMGDMQLQDKKHQDDLDLVDQKAAAQAGLAVVRTNLKHEEQAALNTLENPSGQQQ